MAACFMFAGCAGTQAEQAEGMNTAAGRQPCGPPHGCYCDGEGYWRGPDGRPAMMEGVEIRCAVIDNTPSDKRPAEPQTEVEWCEPHDQCGCKNGHVIGKGGKPVTTADGRLVPCADRGE